MPLANDTNRDLRLMLDWCPSSCLGPWGVSSLPLISSSYSNITSFWSSAKLWVNEDVGWLTSDFGDRIFNPEPLM